ncbi:hypothetical protein ABG067_003740 [Albugo candida]|uniref:Uncharacterized protein n=1 Tax=Albugo candida TaxID=65357 RepID=A0A024G7I2_9STRA|nr:unnamed protein product [Albugo candida]|eukprot:CCI42629.1 unnamed protein product [Albugo candida]
MSDSRPIPSYRRETHSSESLHSAEDDHSISDASTTSNVTADRSDSLANAPFNISQSCPENGHFDSTMHRMQRMTRPNLQAPRAPSLGSVAAPSMHDIAPMPELLLPPPARRHSPAESVLQFPSSCPVSFNYMRQQTAFPLRKNQSNLAASPALAAMSAFQRSHTTIEDDLREFIEESHIGMFSNLTVNSETRLDDDTKSGLDGVNGAIFDFEEQ